MAFNGARQNHSSSRCLGFTSSATARNKKALQALSAGDVIGVRTDDPGTLQTSPCFSIEPNMYCMIGARRILFYH